MQQVYIEAGHYQEYNHPSSDCKWKTRYIMKMRKTWRINDWNEKKGRSSSYYKSKILM